MKLDNSSCRFPPLFLLEAILFAIRGLRLPKCYASSWRSRILLLPSHTCNSDICSAFSSQIYFDAKRQC